MYATLSQSGKSQPSFAHTDNYSVGSPLFSSPFLSLSSSHCYSPSCSPCRSIPSLPPSPSFSLALCLSSSLSTCSQALLRWVADNFGENANPGFPVTVRISRMQERQFGQPSESHWFNRTISLQMVRKSIPGAAH